MHAVFEFFVRLLQARFGVFALGDFVAQRLIGAAQRLGLRLHGLEVARVFNGDDGLRHQAVEQGAFGGTQMKGLAPHHAEHPDEGALIDNGNTVVTPQLALFPPGQGAAAQGAKAVVLKDVGHMQHAVRGGDPAIVPLAKAHGFDGTTLAHGVIGKGQDIERLFSLVGDR